MIFHYSESKQMNLNTFACIRFWIGLRREGHQPGRSQLLKKNMKARTDVSHTETDACPSQHMLSHLQPWTAWRRGEAVLLSSPGGWSHPPPTTPLHALSSKALPLPCFPVGINKARPNPGSNTILWGESITCFDHSYPPHANMLSRYRKWSTAQWGGSCGFLPRQ